MAAPTSLSVAVDSSEYSRYEKEFRDITVTLTATTGTSFSGEAVTFELVKARRDRTGVAYSTSTTLSGASPLDVVETLDLRDMIDQDAINQVRHGEYFIRALHKSLLLTVDGASIFVEVDDVATGDTWEGIEVVATAGATPYAVRQANKLFVYVDSAGTTSAVITALIDGIFGLSATEVTPGTVISSTSLDFTTVTGESETFTIRIITVNRLKKDWLFGIDLKSTQVLEPKFDPVNITGVIITEVSSRHPVGSGTLTYSLDTCINTVTTSLDIGGQVLIINGQKEAFVDRTNLTDFTITTDVGATEVTATITGTSLDVVVPSGATSLATVATAIEALSGFTTEYTAGSWTDPSGATSFTGVETTARTMSWQGGTSVPITGAGTYVLTSGAGLAGSYGVNNNYICVRVRSLALLPSTSINETLIINQKTIDDETLARFIDESVAYLENDLLNCRIEPTRVVTDVDPTKIAASATNRNTVEIQVETDWDFIVTPLTYFIPLVDNIWINIQTPHPSLLRIDNLFGVIANTRVIQISQEWIQPSEHGGFVQLVPYNQDASFDYLGLLWVNTLRGATEIPNFWHYNALVGLREATPDIQEMIGKLAAINALTIAALAFRPGVGSISLSRDGVSESTSFINQQTYGIYTGTIQSYKDWIEDKVDKFRARYRGLNMRVV